METLNGFEEIPVDKQRSEIRIPVMHIELSLNIRYFKNGSGVGYCGLLINGIKGNGLRGKVEAAAAKAYVGRTIFIFLSVTDDGKELITVPALFEKEPSFDPKLDLSNFIIKTYYHDNFKKTPEEVYNEHMNAITGRNIRTDSLWSSIIELPQKGLEILRSYR
jgi:hypothetical protein